MVDKSCWEVWDVECCIENGRLKDLINEKPIKNIREMAGMNNITISPRRKIEDIKCTKEMKRNIPVTNQRKAGKANLMVKEF